MFCHLFSRERGGSDGGKASKGYPTSSYILIERTRCNTNVFPSPFPFSFPMAKRWSRLGRSESKGEEGPGRGREIGKCIEREQASGGGSNMQILDLSF